MKPGRVLAAAGLLVLWLYLVFVTQAVGAIDSTKEFLDALKDLKTHWSSDILGGRETIERYERLGEALEEIKKYEKEELRAASADKSLAEREEAYKKFEEYYKQKVKALDDDFSRDWRRLNSDNELGHPPDLHPRERLEVREAKKRIDKECEGFLEDFSLEDGDAAEKEVEQYRKRRMAMEELYRHGKHDKRLSDSEEEMLGRKHRAKIMRLISKTEDRLKKIAADRKEKARLEAEKKAEETEMTKRTKEQEETRRILAKADDAPFLKESNYPPEMLADPGIQKVLKAYKITLENQKKKIADYARRRDESPGGHLVINWGRETVKAQEELVRMLEVYEKNLDRLKIAWKAPAARK